MFYALGQPVLSIEHSTSLGDETERYSPGRVQHVHEGGEGHPNSRALVRHSVRHFPLAAGEPPGRRDL